MTNKIIIGALVFLVLVSGGLGAYSVNLNRQLNTLSAELAAFQGKTAAEISDVKGNVSTLDTELATFQGETAAEIGDVRGSISTLDSELAAFQGETATEIGDVRGSINTLDTKVIAFKRETRTDIAGIATEISQSTVNVQKLYERVRKAVCEITDGEEVLGSGFVLDTRGYIVTAQHVIDGVSRIDVILHDGTVSSASIVGGGKYSDIAVLELEKTVTLEPLELADSNAVIPGEPAITLGTPFAFSGTVTSGIVSRIKVAENYRENWLASNLIQYDAASNPGNSGGPLVNSQGEIIGMIVAGTGEGINWAVSSNMLRRVADSIIDSGSFETATLPGTWEISDLTPGEARDRNMETTNGVLFLETEGVEGIQADDIIVAVDEVPVREASDLFNYFGEYKSPGDTVTLTVIRDETEVEVTVELVEGWVFVT